MNEPMFTLRRQGSAELRRQFAVPLEPTPAIADQVSKRDEEPRAGTLGAPVPQAG